MIGLDTNVLVRIFARDDAQQAARAIRVIDEGNPGQIFVNVVVLAEFAWTMRRAYKWDDDWIRHALTRIVRHPGHGFVAALEHPVFDGLQVLRRAVGALKHVAVNQPAGAEKR